MIKLEDKTMTKKQYFIPQVETMPLLNTTALCASPAPSPAPGSGFEIIGGGDPNGAQ